LAMGSSHWGLLVFSIICINHEKLLLQLCDVSNIILDGGKSQLMVKQFLLHMTLML
jgi:hypothetical protein